jgi:hypothetical protein
MACLRRSPFDRRIGTVSCDEEGCLHRRITYRSRGDVVVETPEIDCVLQLRLRAGDPEEHTGSVLQLITGERFDKDDVFTVYDPTGAKLYEHPEPTEPYGGLYPEYAHLTFDEVAALAAAGVAARGSLELLTQPGRHEGERTEPQERSVRAIGWNEEHEVEWDVDADLPLYTRDYLRLRYESGDD